jgi:hypothetical protein
MMVMKTGSMQKKEASNARNNSIRLVLIFCGLWSMGAWFYSQSVCLKQGETGDSTKAVSPVVGIGTSDIGQGRSYSREKLRALFTELVDKEVAWNNWRMGCNDLQFFNPYLRAIVDQQAWGGPSPSRKVIIDVGANKGDDAVSIIRAFQGIMGMCGGFSPAIQLVSAEPSPKVFCELQDFLTTHLVETEKSKQSSALLCGPCHRLSFHDVALFLVPQLLLLAVQILRKAYI